MYCWYTNICTRTYIHALGHFSQRGHTDTRSRSTLSSFLSFFLLFFCLCFGRTIHFTIHLFICGPPCSWQDWLEALRIQLGIPREAIEEVEVSRIAGDTQNAEVSFSTGSTDYSAALNAQIKEAKPEITILDIVAAASPGVPPPTVYNQITAGVGSRTRGAETVACSMFVFALLNITSLVRACLFREEFVYLLFVPFS